jgi:hypothetical protein
MASSPPNMLHHPPRIHTCTRSSSHRAFPATQALDAQPSLATIGSARRGRRALTPGTASHELAHWDSSKIPLPCSKKSKNEHMSTPFDYTKSRGLVRKEYDNTQEIANSSSISNPFNSFIALRFASSALLQGLPRASFLVH